MRLAAEATRRCARFRYPERVTVVTIRPSTAQLDLNLRALIAEFSLRDMGCEDVSLFLGCSLSSARNYINRLLDAGYVAPRRTGGACRKTRVLYRARRGAGDAILPSIAATPRTAPAPIDPGPPGAADELNASLTLRDPLVAAFFGNPAAPRQRSA